MKETEKVPLLHGGESLDNLPQEKATLIFI
jgi:hypothetical protein